VCDASCGGPCVVSIRCVAVNVFDHRDHNSDRLRRVISLFDWSVVTCVTEISAMYAHFLEVLTLLVNTSVPVNVVRLGPRDPPLSHLSLCSYFVNEIICDAELDIRRLTVMLRK